MTSLDGRGAGPPRGFEHSAVLYAGDDGFLGGVLPFVRAGVEGGEPTMVVVQAPRIDALRRALGRQGGLVDFVDMDDAGRNPTRIIGLWQDFVDAHAGADRPVRGVGEPVWADRDQDELVECRNHEALLNVAFASSSPWRLLCPYDTSTLAASSLRTACDTHPVVHGGHSTMDGDDLGDACDPLQAPLSEPPPSATVVRFGARSLGEVRTAVSRAAASVGLRSARISDLLLAVDEVATNSVRHGGGSGVLHLWTEPAGVVCSVSDRGHIRDALIGRTRPRPGSGQGAGLWLVNQVCDLVQVRSSPAGSVVRMRMRRD